MANKTIYEIKYNNFKFTKQEIPVVAETSSMYITEGVRGVYLKVQENNICGHSLFTTDKDLFEYEATSYFLDEIKKEYKQLLDEAQNNYNKIMAVLREEKKNIPDVIDRPVKLDPSDPLIKAMIADIEYDDDDIKPILKVDTHEKADYIQKTYYTDDMISKLNKKYMVSEDVIIRDNDKAKEIIDKLKQPRDKNIRASHPEKLPENANNIWFGNGRGWKGVYISPENANKFVDALIDAEKNPPKEVDGPTIPELSKEDIGKIFTHKQITEAVDNLLADAKKAARGEGEYYTYEDIFSKEDKE